MSTTLLSTRLKQLNEAGVVTQTENKSNRQYLLTMPEMN